MNYVNVCTPATLRMMAERLPTTKASLTQIDGFPDQKYAKFEGIKFLNITTEYNNRVTRTCQNIKYVTANLSCCENICLG